MLSDHVGQKRRRETELEQAVEQQAKRIRSLEEQVADPFLLLLSMLPLDQEQIKTVRDIKNSEMYDSIFINTILPLVFGERLRDPLLDIHVSPEYSIISCKYCSFI